jgi:predicted N-acetyltransferase YhbS
VDVAIREENPEDAVDVRRVNEDAFGGRRKPGWWNCSA